MLPPSKIIREGEAPLPARPLPTPMISVSVQRYVPTGMIIPPANCVWGILF